MLIGEGRSDLLRISEINDENDRGGMKTILQSPDGRDPEANCILGK